MPGIPVTHQRPAPWHQLLRSQNGPCLFLQLAVLALASQTPGCMNCGAGHKQSLELFSLMQPQRLRCLGA